MKKLVNVFSLCVILSSFLFTSLTAIAQTSSSTSDSSVSKSESIVNGESSSTQTKATEEESVKKSATATSKTTVPADKENKKSKGTASKTTAQPRAPSVAAGKD